MYSSVVLSLRLIYESTYYKQIVSQKSELWLLKNFHHNLILLSIIEKYYTHKLYFGICSF